MTVSFKLVTPGRSWLQGQSARDPDRHDRYEARRQATYALDEIDAALASSRSTGSTCGQCRAPIRTTATYCPTCGAGYLDVSLHSSTNLRHTAYEGGIEYSRHVGKILAVR